MPFPSKVYEDKVLRAALAIAKRRMHRHTSYLTEPYQVRDYLHIWAAGLENEAFGVIWLTTKHQVIETEVLFHGSIDSASVFPRVVVQRALAHNAGAVLLFHNHPSGNPEPSQADRVLTARLKESLALVDVRVLDHLVVADKITSLAEYGWI